MINKILPVLLIFLLSCSSPNPPAKTARPRSHSKNKSIASKPATGTWNVMTYPGTQEGQTARKYVTCETDGNFSNQSLSNIYLNADIIVDKVNAGILLHQSKKTNPAEKFTGMVRIKMKNSAGNVLEMTSSRGWNKSGGILIERNNNDYSRFRIFLLQSEGLINVEISYENSSVYNFDIDTTGFAEAFSQI
jgi:hypothetical protein